MSSATFDLADALPGATLRPRVAREAPPTASLPTLELRAEPAGAERLGEGGMGVVDAMRDHTLDREVAVKRPHRDALAEEALLVEARTLAALAHPGIVPVHALGRDADGRPALVMKRVRGQRWSDLPRDTPEREVERLLRVADAVRFAHDRGWLHRDIKPDNVMVGEHGEVYLMDWGCACAIDATTGDPVGTPAYLAPEMLIPGARLSCATDVYLLGATLHDRLAGAPRHRGVNVRAVLDAAAASRPMPWPQHVPRELGALVDRACHADPARRFPRVDELEAALRAWLGHREAARLAEAGTRAADAMRAAIAADEPGVDRRFAEARFRYRAALEAWPECPEARRGTPAVIRDYVPWKLAQGELAAIEALLPELPDREHWAALLADRRRAREAEEEAWRRGSIEVGMRQRRDLALALLGMSTLTLIGLPLVADPAAATHRLLLTTGAASLVIVPVAVLLSWRRISGHRLTRGVALALVGLQAASLVHRVLGWASGTDPSAVLRDDALLMGSSVVMLGLASVPALVIPGLPYLVAAGLMVAAPAHASSLFGVAAISSLVAAVAIFWPRQGARLKDN